MSELTERIRSRGHWEIVIRPSDFVADSVPYGALDAVLRKAVVRLRGWPVPFIDDREAFLGGEDWIGQDIDADIVSQFEAWRFWTSGQFTHLRSVSADWRVGREGTRVPESFSGVIEVWEILYYLTEVFELAARLAFSGGASDSTVVDATLHGLADRGLIVGNPRGEFIEPYRSRVPQLKREVTFPNEVLVAEARPHAVKMALEFFMRFGWRPSIDQLTEHQQELVEGR